MHKKQLSKTQHQHIAKLLKQKFISPYKILYMLDQKQADYFKSRNVPQSQPAQDDNKHKNCKQIQSSCSCSLLSTILIPYNKQTKLEKIVTDTIINVPNYLNQIMQFCEDRYQNIIKSGKKDNLQITSEVQKFLIQKIMSQTAHSIVYAKAAKTIKQSAQSMNTQIGLWATPATWKNKYPNIQLSLFKGQNLKQLSERGFTIIKFSDKNSLNQRDDLGRQLIPQNIYSQLQLLEKDGKFEQVLTHSNSKSRQIKVLNNPQKFGFLQNGEYFPQTKLIIMILQSIPFEMNMKMNSYMTVNESIQVYHTKVRDSADNTDSTYPLAQLTHSQNMSKYSMFIPIGISLNTKLVNKQKGGELNNMRLVNNGDLLIFEAAKFQLQLQQEIKHKKCNAQFIITHNLYTAAKI